MGVKIAQALRSALTLLGEPLNYNAGVLFFDAFAETRALRSAYARMIASLSAVERDRLRELTARAPDLTSLGQMRKGTLGRAYADFLAANGFRPDAARIAHPRIAEAFAIEWAYERFTRVHDFHHVLLGFAADPVSEVGLQAFNLANFGEPFSALAMLAVPMVALRYGEPARLTAEVARGLRLGLRLRPLFTAPFEDWFEEELDAVRQRLGVSSTPGLSRRRVAMRSSPRESV